MILSIAWFLSGIGTGLLLAAAAIALGCWVLNTPYSKYYDQEDEQDGIYW
jgi:hypothetical protein